MENTNLKIARELNKIAKELVAGENVANQQGKYKNFTGTIDWQGTKGQVRNATFSLDKYGIYWYDGTWEQGTWEQGTWEYGTWQGGTWKNGRWNIGYWDGGTWKNGTWNNGYWYDGIWLNGTWNNGYWYGGTWKKGIWEEGEDNQRNFHSRGDSPDKWNK